MDDITPLKDSPSIKPSEAKKEATDDSPIQGIYEVAELSKLGRFFRTRKLVLAGEKPWEWSPKQRLMNNVMGPWETNFFESFLVSFPWIALFWCLSFFLEPQVVAGLSEREIKFNETFSEIDSVLSKALLPIILMFFAWFVGYASLRSENSSPFARRKAMHAYLYLDGSMGLSFQFILVLAFSILDLLAKFVFSDSIKSLLFWSAIALLSATTIWFLAVFNIKLPQRLFAANGYSKEVPRLFGWFREKKDFSERGPWLKYQFWTLFIATPVIMLLVALLYTGIFVFIDRVLVP